MSLRRAKAAIALALVLAVLPFTPVLAEQQLADPEDLSKYPGMEAAELPKVDPETIHVHVFYASPASETISSLCTIHDFARNLDDNKVSVTYFVVVQQQLSYQGAGGASRQSCSSDDLSPTTDVGGHAAAQAGIERVPRARVYFDGESDTVPLDAVPEVIREIFRNFHL